MMFEGITRGDITLPNWAGYRQHTPAEFEDGIRRAFAKLHEQSASPDHAWLSQENYDRLAAALANVSHSSAVALTAEVGIAAAVALGGFCWLIARRSQLAREADDETFVSMVGQWLASFWAQFLAAIANKPKELTE